MYPAVVLESTNVCTHNTKINGNYVLFGITKNVLCRKYPFTLIISKSARDNVSVVNSHDIWY